MTRTASQRKGSAAGSAKASGRDSRSTRSRMIAAAIDCVLDLGLYRATSNEIARRAGLTWGAIQRQFGTREALMLAVFQQEWSRLVETQRETVIVGNSPAERIRCLYDALTSYYSRPEAFIGMQIAMDFRKDPRTSEAALATIREMTKESLELMPKLMRQVFPGDAYDPTVAHFVYFAIRDFNIGRHMEAVTAPAETVADRLSHLHAEQGLLIRCLESVSSLEVSDAGRRPAPSKKKVKARTKE